MLHDPEARRGRLARVVSLLAGVAMLLYLALAALHGEHGLFRLLEVQREEHALLAGRADLRAERDALSAKVARLSADDPDLDLLEEQSRKVLGLARPDELLAR